MTRGGCEDPTTGWDNFREDFFSFFWPLKVSLAMFCVRLDWDQALNASSPMISFIKSAKVCHQVLKGLRSHDKSCWEVMRAGRGVLKLGAINHTSLVPRGDVFSDLIVPISLRDIARGDEVHRPAITPYLNSSVQLKLYQLWYNSQYVLIIYCA